MQYVHTLGIFEALLCVLWVVMIGLDLTNAQVSERLIRLDPLEAFISQVAAPHPHYQTTPRASV